MSTNGSRTEERSRDHPGTHQGLAGHRLRRPRPPHRQTAADHAPQVNGSYRQAEKVEARLRTEVADGQHAGTRLKTLGELVDLWIERRAASDKPISPDTVEDYRSLIAKKIKPALGGKRLHTVTARVLDAFYDDLRRSGNAKAASRARARARAEAITRGEDPSRAAATAKPTASDQRLSANRVRDVHVILSGALGMAARWGWIPFNPALMARPAGGKGKSRPVPTPQQVRDLFGALTDDPDFAVFLRLSTTAGLRPCEICALRWLDLDLDAATVSINGSVVTAKSLSRKYARKDPRAPMASGSWLWTPPRSSCFARIEPAANSLQDSSTAGWTRRRTCSPGHRTAGRHGGRTPSASGSRPWCVGLGTTTRCMGSGTSWPRNSAPWQRPARSASGWDTAVSRSRAATCTGSTRLTAPLPSTWARCLIGTNEVGH
jgi:integrase